MILAIDQGTTGTTCLILDKDSQIVDRSYQEFTQIFPQPAWVEHDPEEIWQSVIQTINQLDGEKLAKVVAIGITNQRETTVVWDKKTGVPVYNAIVWQCRRTSDYCQTLTNSDEITHKTGLPVDPYFSASKINWILNETKVDPDTVLFGTIDSWLIYKLTGNHYTDHTNASRTLLYNIETKSWDSDLCKTFAVAESMLPKIKNSIADFGEVNCAKLENLSKIKILAVAGDQQAALFGQCCVEKGEMKNTYGTGAFMMMNTGDELIRSTHGILTTIAIDATGAPCYALEGSVFIAGAAIQWIRDELELIKDAAESEAAALAVDDTAGVYLVPAFVGLGAPWWTADARGIITGLTRGANKNHIIRAALESMAYQSLDVLEAIEKDAGLKVSSLAVDGGATANNFLMQFQADILQVSVIRPGIIDSTALGAAYLAGINAGIWKDVDELRQKKEID
ncbi:MAG: glycerol kinase GlpK, partial [Lentisphaeria bacterium]|nr:glycerol kinase GlpK [Lentisphaeria bacterium]